MRGIGSVSLWMAVVLAQAGVAAASEHPASEPVAPSPDAEVAPLPEPEMGEEVIEACGGGPPTVVDTASMAMYDGDYVEARNTLVGALQTGEVDAWQRGMALAVLAEAQLELGQPRAAARNFAQALEVDPEGAGTAARVGLATALFQLGRPGEADEQARTFIEDECGGQWADAVSCFGAQYLRSYTAGDDTSAFEALRAAGRIRSENPDLDESFDELAALIDAGRKSE